MMVFISVPVNCMHKMVARHSFLVYSVFSFSRKSKEKTHVIYLVVAALEKCNGLMLGLFVDTRLYLYALMMFLSFFFIYFRLICGYYMVIIFSKSGITFSSVPNFIST